MVYYSGIIVANSDLYHHGILGQKWGRRNGPPYPLGSGRHSAAEKKAGWTKSLSNGSEKKSKYKDYKTASKDMTDSERNKVDKQNIKIAKKNAIRAYKDAKKSAGKVMSYNKKIRAGKEEKITKRERRAVEIMKTAMDQYDQSKIQATEKLINKTLDKKQTRDMIVNAIAWSTLTNVGVVVPIIITGMKGARAINFLDTGKKSIREENKKAPDLKGDDYGSFKSKREERKKAKVERNVRERLADIKKNDPEQYEQIKKNTIRTGKASDMKYFVDDMDNNELQYAINRIENKARLNQLSNKEVKTNWDRAKEVSEKLKIVADLTTNAANIYNNLNRMTPSSNNQNNQQQQKKKN